MLWTVVAFVLAFVSASGHRVATKQYYCNETTGKCDLYKGNGIYGSEFMGQSTCLMICNNGALWPYPTGAIDIKVSYAHISFNNIEDSLRTSVKNLPAIANKMVDETINVLAGKYSGERKIPSINTKEVNFIFSVENTEVLTVSPGVDESYTLTTSVSNGEINVKINANTVFGFRHGLETLSQLVSWDELLKSYTVASEVQILNDKPQYRYRGVMVDISRNFISLSKLKNIIRGMGYNKLNVLHLHLADTASFPVEMLSYQNITYYGAYSEDAMYTQDSLIELVAFASVYGVMILPELDGPSHVAAGFEWGENAGLGKLVVCDDPNGYRTDAWLESGLEPPSGQWNLANPNIYVLLKEIYAEFSRIFEHSSAFHIGGDEIIVGSDTVTPNCYNNSIKAREIITMLEENGFDRTLQDSFYSLWTNYTEKVSALVIDAYENSLTKLHIWGGAGVDPLGVTYNMLERDDFVEVLPPSKYVIQVWDDSHHSIVPKLVENGYEVVLSHTDYVYLDCGNAGSAGAGGYWCQPYHEWQHIYQYITDLEGIWDVELDPEFIMGSETLIWTEMIDSVNVEQKIWPRTAALAEALWGRSSGNPKTSSWYAADPRLQQWRRTLVSRGIDAEALQPRWCDDRGSYACTANIGSPQ